MLLFNGSAECQESSKWLKKGARHEFYMFSKNRDLFSQLESIEAFFTARGLDNIEISAAEQIDDEAEITNEMLMYAYQEAEQKGMSGTIVRAPIAA